MQIKQLVALLSIASVANSTELFNRTLSYTDQTNGKEFEIELTVESNFIVEGYGDAQRDMHQLTLFNKVTSLDGPINAMNDLALVGSRTYINDLNGTTMFLFHTDDQDGTKLIVSSDRDNWKTEKKYEYNRDGKLTSSIGMTNLVREVGTPVVTYDDAKYSKTTLLKVTTIFSHGADEAALARGQNWDGHNVCNIISQTNDYVSCISQVDFTYENDLTFDDNLVEGIGSVRGEINELKKLVQAIQDKLDDILS